MDRPGIGVSYWIPTGLPGSLAQVSRRPTGISCAPQRRATQGYVLANLCQGSHVSKAWTGDGIRLPLDGLSLVLSRWLDPPAPLLPLGIRIRDLALPLWAPNPGLDRDLLPRLDG